MQNCVRPCEAKLQSVSEKMMEKNDGTKAWTDLGFRPCFLFQESGRDFSEEFLQLVEVFYLDHINAMFYSLKQVAYSTNSMG